MFKFLKKQEIPPKSQRLKFDEDYCHSAGENSNAKTYKIDKGTTEIVFDFGNFNNFWDTYINKNQHLPESTFQAINDASGVFCAQIVAECQYIYIPTELTTKTK